MKKERKKPDLRNIKMLVLDVDGVLTDGTIVVDETGRETKFFNVLDGHGIRMWRRAGMKTAFLSGRKSGPTKQQASELSIEYCLENCKDKLACFEKLLEKSGLSAGQIAYAGDDLPDLPVMKRAGFAAAVPDAADEIKKAAHYITKKKGGSGAVREIIEYILKKTGKWDIQLQRYLK